jgi:translation initiation factor IF-3
LNPIYLLKNFSSSNQAKTRINHAIKASELRVIGPEGENLGLLKLADALKTAEERSLDLIEISPNATPPVAKVMDFGKYRYETSRKSREIKAKSHVTETKSVQVKIGTGEHDQKLKAKRAAEWLEDGHRVKVDLFLWGRYKAMDEFFLKERLNYFLKIIPTEYKIADEIKRSPKGFTITIERVPGTKATFSTKEHVKKIETKVKSVNRVDQPGQKSKKLDLDELLEKGMV